MGGGREKNRGIKAVESDSIRRKEFESGDEVEKKCRLVQRKMDGQRYHIV